LQPEPAGRKLDRMSIPVSLSTFQPVAFVTVRDPERSKIFYRDTLGLKLVSEELPFALVFDLQGISLRVAIDPNMVSVERTVLGWRVQDIENTARALAAAGVAFQRYGFMQQDELGIWNSPGGARVAWFKDPDGNVLSLSQHP
jgi:catechol 2,3-dioxygenase-like lactoylglutathione lyase family enzyme